MKAQLSFPCLKVIALDRLLHHEEQDPARVERLLASLSEQGILRNPLMVAEREGSLIVLDGVSRSLALRRMGIPHAVVQVVEDTDKCVRLETWNHVVLGPPGEDILKGFETIPGVRIHTYPLENLRHSLARRESILGVVLRDGEVYGLRSTMRDADLAQRLCQTVAAYRDRAEVQRTSETDLSALLSRYPDMSALILFPHIRVQDVTHAALNNSKLPMGITRHLIRGRALGLNIPLTLLAGDSSLEEKNARLQDMVRERLKKGGVRLYQEATYMFDEVA